MKTATLNRSQTIGDKYFLAGTPFEYLKKLKFFTTIKVGEEINSIYTADLENFTYEKRTKTTGN